MSVALFSSGTLLAHATSHQTNWIMQWEKESACTYTGTFQATKENVMLCKPNFTALYVQDDINSDFTQVFKKPTKAKRSIAA